MNSSTRNALLFVFLWSSAYFAFKFCSPHVEPATFVAIRTGTTAILIYLVILFKGSSWPRRWVDIVPCIVVGILMHGIYAGGMFASIYHGIDLRLSALILSLQPILTLLLSATFLNEKITQRMVIGIAAGFLGVTTMILEGSATTSQLVILEGGDASFRNGSIAIALCSVALLAISIATIVQKRYCHNIELMPGAFIQYSSALYFMIPFALILETMQINWVLEFTLSMGWLVIVVSICAMTLLMSLIKSDSAGAVANLFFLITPLVAIGSWILFDEKLGPLSIVGLLLCMTGVFFVTYHSPVKPNLAPVRLSKKVIFSKRRSKAYQTVVD